MERQRQKRENAAQPKAQAFDVRDYHDHFPLAYLLTKEA
jgi:hypothetical protein